MNVFALMGHGCDLVNENRKIVPKNCKYITLKTCGAHSLDLPKIYYAFQDPSIAYALANPDNIHLYNELQKYFEIGATLNLETNIRIHNPGDEYTDSVNTLIADAHPLIWKSGVYRLGQAPNLPNGKIYTDAMYDRSLTLYEIQELYVGSLIQPISTLQYYPQGIEQFKAINNSFSPTISSLMDSTPGIYYNFACRIPCYESNEKEIDLIRLESNMQFHTSPTSTGFRSYKYNKDAITTSTAVAHTIQLWKERIDATKIERCSRMLEYSRQSGSPIIDPTLRNILLAQVFPSTISNFYNVEMKNVSRKTRKYRKKRANTRRK